MADQSKSDAERLAHVREHGGWHKSVYWLTPAEREELTRTANENDEYFKKLLSLIGEKCPSGTDFFSLPSEERERLVREAQLVIKPPSHQS